MKLIDMEMQNVKSFAASWTLSNISM